MAREDGGDAEGGGDRNQEAQRRAAFPAVKGDGSRFALPGGHRAYAVFERKMCIRDSAKGNAGEHLCTNPPYGYQKEPMDKKKWIVDEEAAESVRRIFALCIAGKGPMQIAKLLTCLLYTSRCV